MDQVKLTRGQRLALIRSAQRFRREHDAALADVAEHVAAILFDEPERFGTGEIEAIAISDYAYGVAQFVCPDRDW